MAEEIKKLLITGGDSYTAQNYPLYQELEIISWPELLAKRKGYDLINTARSGCSNRHILNSVMDAVIENEEREIIVIVSWSEVYRLSFIDDIDLDQAVFLISEKESNKRCSMSKMLAMFFDRIDTTRKEYIKHILWNQSKTNQTDVEKMISLNSKLITQSFKTMWMLQDFCKNRRIMFYHLNTFDPLSSDFFLSKEIYSNEVDTSEESFKSVLENKYFQYVQQNVNYMGYNYCIYNDIEKNKLFIDYDNVINLHPNQKGHNFIATKVDSFLENNTRPNPNTTDNKHLYRFFK